MLSWFCPGIDFPLQKKIPVSLRIGSSNADGKRVQPWDRPVHGLVWFLSVPGTWEKSKDQEIFGEEQSLESPALAPYFRGTEGLVTPHDLHAATGDTQLSVQPQEHTHLPTWGCLLILSSGISQRSKTRANPRSTCWGKEGSRTVSHISWVTRALPVSFTCGQGRLGFAAGGSVPCLGQNSRMKKSQEEGRGRCDISRSGCECQGKGREMTFTVRDAVNGIDWKTKISTEGSKKAPWSPHGLKIPSCGWGWSGARWKGKNGTLRSNPTHPSLRPFVHIRRARQDVSLACKLQLGNTTLWWGKLVNVRLPIFVVRNEGLTVSITIQW